MAMAGMDNAGDIAAAEVKGIGLPTPALEKQIAMENKEPFPTSVQSSDDEQDDPDFVRKPTEEELHTLRRVPAKIPVCNSWLSFWPNPRLIWHHVVDCIHRFVTCDRPRDIRILIWSQWPLSSSVSVSHTMGAPSFAQALY